MMNKMIYGSHISYVFLQLQLIKKGFKYLNLNGTDWLELECAENVIGTAASKIEALIPKADIETYGENAIFATYFEAKDRFGSFEQYFHNCSNPDYAPIEFLEELDRLIEINKERKVAIAVDADDNEHVKAAEILNNYLSGTPPF